MADNEIMLALATLQNFVRDVKAALGVSVRSDCLEAIRDLRAHLAFHAPVCVPDTCKWVADRAKELSHG